MSQAFWNHHPRCQKRTKHFKDQICPSWWIIFVTINIFINHKILFLLINFYPSLKKNSSITSVFQGTITVLQKFWWNAVIVGSILPRLHRLLLSRIQGIFLKLGRVQLIATASWFLLRRISSWDHFWMVRVKTLIDVHIPRDMLLCRRGTDIRAQIFFNLTWLINLWSISFHEPTYATCWTGLRVILWIFSMWWFFMTETRLVFSFSGRSWR